MPTLVFQSITSQLTNPQFVKKISQQIKKG